MMWHPPSNNITVSTPAPHLISVCHPYKDSDSRQLLIGAYIFSHTFIYKFQPQYLVATWKMLVSKYQYLKKFNPSSSRQF